MSIGFNSLLLNSSAIAFCTSAVASDRVLVDASKSPAVSSVFRSAFTP